MSKTSFFCLFSIIFLIFSPPFIVEGILFGNSYPWIGTFSLFFIIVIFFFGYKQQIEIKLSDICLFAVSALYSFHEYFLGTNYLMQWIREVEWIIYLWIYYKVAIVDSRILTKTKKILVFMSYYIPISVFMLKILYAYLPSLFDFRDVIGYHDAILPLFGCVNLDKYFTRISWYFAEPSYLAFIIGLLVIFLYTRRPKKYKMIMFINVLAGFIIQSDTFLYLLPLIFLIIILNVKDKIFLSLFIKLLVIFLLIYVMLILPTMDLAAYSKYISAGSSIWDRQQRIALTYYYMSKFSMSDLFLGAGPNFMAYTTSTGESNTYFKIIVEYGVLYFAIWGFYILKLVKNLVLFTYCVVGFMSVILFNAPLVWLIILYIYIVENKNLKRV